MAEKRPRYSARRGADVYLSSLGRVTVKPPVGQRYRGSSSSAIRAPFCLEMSGSVLPLLSFALVRAVTFILLLFDLFVHDRRLIVRSSVRPSICLSVRPKFVEFGEFVPRIRSFRCATCCPIIFIRDNFRFVRFSFPRFFLLFLRYVCRLL